MSFLRSLDINRCIDFYSIKDDQIPSEVGLDQDLFIGTRKRTSLTIDNGTTVQVRDIVVFGEFSAQSTDTNSNAVKGFLVARDIFICGSFKTNNLDITCRWYKPSGLSSRQELQDILIDWFKFQRESVDKIGLKSVLL